MKKQPQQSQKQQTDKVQGIPKDYPLEVVADLAARFLVMQNYRDAALKAVALLDECKAVLEGRVTPKVETVVAAEPTDMGWDTFVEYLTDGERRDRAEPKINDYFKFEIQIHKAKDLAEETFGTFGKGAWQQFLHLVPATTPEELTARIQEINKPIELLHGGTRPAIIARNIVRTHKEQFELWRQINKAKAASEKGTKGGRPKSPQKEK